MQTTMQTDYPVPTRVGQTEVYHGTEYLGATVRITRVALNQVRVAAYQTADTAQRLFTHIWLDGFTHQWVVDYGERGTITELGREQLLFKAVRTAVLNATERGRDAGWW